jgi:glyoxylase-like metal-dependent hydrolase (beta-lactamase superfamily II)
MGLWRAALTPAPFLAITNRMLIVRWMEGNRRRTLLFDPTDVELAARTPYFAELDRKTPSFLRRATVTQHGTVLGRLAEAGIRPEEVDYIAYDHLHTQDVRRLLGTARPQADLGGVVAPALPNARLVVQRAELAALRDLHPLQRPWYQPEAYRDLRPESLAIIDGDVLLGPGVALLSTPGHTTGNQTLVLHTRSGIWACSENAIAAECLTPEHSKIPGVAAWARRWGQEVILNANTLEESARQYNSMMLEKHLVDRAESDARFLQFFPTSELTRTPLAPGAGPTFTHGALGHARA